MTYINELVTDIQNYTKGDVVLIILTVLVSQLILYCQLKESTDKQHVLSTDDYKNYCVFQNTFFNISINNKLSQYHNFSGKATFAMSKK